MLGNKIQHDLWYDALCYLRDDLWADLTSELERSNMKYSLWFQIYNETRRDLELEFRYIGC